MSGENTPTALRVLILTLNLVNTQIGYTKWELRDLVPGYREVSESTFQRNLERDLEALRETGLLVETIPEGNDFRYLIGGASFAASSVNFDARATEILVEAASAWELPGTIAMARLLSKLSAYTQDGDLDTSPNTVDDVASHRLEGTEYLPSIVKAIETLQPISFTYDAKRGRETREVAPWSLVIRGRAVYLWGFDLNRWDKRLFRLSRIRSQLEPVGEPGAYELPADPQEGLEYAPFRVAPLLWIRQNQADLVRLHCTETIPAKDYPSGVFERRGWDLVQGNEEDQDLWHRLIFDNCLDVVVQDPHSLADYVLNRLRKGIGESAGTKRGHNGE